MSIRQNASMLGFISLVCLVQACSPPSGPDLVACHCSCTDSFDGTLVPGGGEVCTDGHDTQAMLDACKSVCDGKNAKAVCFPPPCPDIGLQHCGPGGPDGSPQVIAFGGCPDNHNPNAGGDFGQALATAAG